ncbi:macrophage mannose receptor 1-like isoform X6, partial [Clarias magur]
HFSGSAKFISITSLLLTWFEARTYCRQHHTDLASSFNSSDQNMLNQLLSPFNSPWFGLYRDTWKWSDGTNATDLPWAPGQPDNYGGNANCAVVYNDQFFDEPCTTMYYFFCHTNFPTRSQIMQLQVKSDGSVLDQAVQSSIFKQ